VKTYRSPEFWHSAFNHVLALHQSPQGWEGRYYSVVENRRLQSGKVAQRQVLYLGEVNDSQQAAWRKSLETKPGAT
jgi:hypothetical protein